MASALEAVDAEAAAVQTGWRITLEDLTARVADVEYLTRDVLTVCLIQLDNGWWLVGRSAPVDPANYDAGYGRQAAYDDALRQAWPLLAFAHAEAGGPPVARSPQRPTPPGVAGHGLRPPAVRFTDP